MLRSLQDARDRLERTEGFADSLEPSVILARHALIFSIMDEQPYGHTEELYGTTVSQRLNHTPISDGWRSVIQEVAHGIKLSLSNVSEHVLAVLGGTPRHWEPMTGAARMYFWWGHPHRWPQKDDLPPGPRLFRVVDHPGASPNPFLSRAKDRATPSMRDHIKSGVADYIRQQFIAAGLREV